MKKKNIGGTNSTYFTFFILGELVAGVHPADLLQGQGQLRRVRNEEVRQDGFQVRSSSVIYSPIINGTTFSVPTMVSSVKENVENVKNRLLVLTLVGLPNQYLKRRYDQVDLL